MCLCYHHFIIRIISLMIYSFIFGNIWYFFIAVWWIKAIAFTQYFSFAISFFFLASYSFPSTMEIYYHQKCFSCVSFIIILIFSTFSVVITWYNLLSSKHRKNFQCHCLFVTWTYANKIIFYSCISQKQFFFINIYNILVISFL